MNSDCCRRDCSYSATAAEFTNENRLAGGRPSMRGPGFELWYGRRQRLNPARGKGAMSSDAAGDCLQLSPAENPLPHCVPQHRAGESVRFAMDSALCRCLRGRPSSAARIRSMIPVNGSSFGRAGGRLRCTRGAPKTPASWPPSAGKSQNAAPLPAGSHLQSEPHNEPARKAPRPSSPGP